MKTLETVERPIMVIGDIPTPMEVRKNVAMTGPAVSILSQALLKVGINPGRDNIYYTTAIKCAIPKKKGKAVPKDPILNCREALLREVVAVKPRLILVLGKTATQVLFKDPGIKISDATGRVGFIPEFPDISIIPIIHPAALVHSPGDYKPFLASLQMAASMFKGEEQYDPGEVKWQVLRDDELCDKAIRFLSLYKRVAADIETTSLDYRIAEFCVLGICYDKNKVFVIPREQMHRVKDFFAIPGIKWTWHHGKYDSKVAWRRGIGEVPLDNDTIYMHSVLDETSEHNLGTLTKVFLNAQEYKYKMNQNFKAVTLESYPKFFESLCERVAVDCDYTFQLEEVLMGKLKEEPKLEVLYNELIIPMANFLQRVERNGLLVNPEHLEALDVEYDKLLAEIMDNVQALAEPYWDPELYKAEMGAKSAPVCFNPGSPKQMQWMVFKRLQLKPRRKKGLSTDKDVLNSIEPQHPLVAEVLHYRTVQKEQSTYVKGILRRRDVDGRIRTTFSAHIAATGRTTSREPNVQNMPSANGIGNVRKAIVAPKGKVLLEIDFSGAELRVLAFVSGCPVLSKVFIDNRNLHVETATNLYGPNFTKQDKMRAKAANFGIAYGREEKSFVDEYGMTKEEAAALVQGWLNTYYGARDYLNMCADSVLAGKYLESPFFRRRRFGLVTPESLHSLQNEAKNFAIQGTSSDLLIESAIEVENPLKDEYDTDINNLIHDSMLLETPNDLEVIQAVSIYVTGVMADMPKKLLGCDIPFKSDIDIGFDWGSLVAYDVKTQTVSWEVKGQDDVVMDASTWLKENVPTEMYNKPWYLEAMKNRIATRHHIMEQKRRNGPHLFVPKDCVNM